MNGEEDEDDDEEQISVVDDPVPQKVDSPLLDEKTKQKLHNLGQSFDSKRMTDALSQLDLKMIIRCLSQALMKHIEFSRGFLFLSDLQDYLKYLEEQGEEADPKLEFSYDLRDNLKVQVGELKKKA